MTRKIPSRSIVFILLAWIVLGPSLFSQQAGVTKSGPSEMGQCEQGTFTISFTNSGTEGACGIVVTDTRPNDGFSYVAGSSVVTLHDGSSYTSDPAQSGLDLIWNIDDLVREPPYELPPGKTLTVGFRLATSCAALSGTNRVRVDYRDCASGTPRQATDSMSIRVLPGAVRIYKEPSVITARVGDTVTWTIIVENTGLGTIYNVVVTDVLGLGLSYESSNPPGTVDGKKVTWEVGTIPAGGRVQLQLSAKVIACEGLDNKADVRFGCDDGSVCFNTAVDGGTVTASISLIVDNPLLAFTPPTILLPYCDRDGTTVRMPIKNTGAGPATDVRISVNFPATFSIQNVQGGASWDGSQFHLPDLASGGTFDLIFDVVYTGGWCTRVPSGSLYWQAIYKNVCRAEFRPPAVFGTYGTDYGPAGTPTVSVALDGPNQVLICSEYDFPLSVSFSGLTTCGGGTQSQIAVEVTVPDGFVVVDPGGGTWTPGPGGTGGTITWTRSPDAPLATTLVLRSPGSTRCGQVATLTATASATDCCGCELSASDSVTMAIECRELVDTVREVSHATQEKCGAITYTNTYTFVDDAALNDVNFNELIFTERADNLQDYVEGTLSITIDGTPADPIAVVDTTPGGTFVIRGIADTRSVRGRTLVISYQLRFTRDSAPASCPASYGFYSWADLDLGPDCLTGDECTAYCVKSEATMVTAATPSMSVSLTGLPADFVDPCGTYDITLTLTKTSDFDPYNVELQLGNLNYYIVDPGSIQVSGVQPTSVIPTEYGTYYEWDYGDAFVGRPNGAQSVLTFQVRKRCNPGTELVATALFEDSCGYSSCSVSASAAPAIMRQPLLYIYKTPQVIYATRNEVTWNIYVINGGAGPAYEVWVDDILGSGLEYVSATVDPDVTITPNRDHTGAPINGVSFRIPEISPGGTRMITITARLVACTGLTNTVKAGISCGGEECVIPVSDTSYVLIPSTHVVATSFTQSPMDPCTENWAQITIRNAGDPAVYDLVARETLPPGMEYVTGTTQWQVDGAAWNPGGDPTITGSISTGYTLVWTEREVSGLAELRSRRTLNIRFQVRSLCNFAGGNLEVDVEFLSVCGEPGAAPLGRFYVGVRQPELRVSKTQIAPPPRSPINCGGEVTWEIKVTNTGDAVADYVWVEDTLGDGLSYVSSRGDGRYAVDDGSNSGQLVTWALEDLPPGARATLYLTARDNGTCRRLTNEVKAWWGCGDDRDDSSATNDATCLSDIPATDSTTATRTPKVDLTPSLDVGKIEPCGQATITLAIKNPSTATAEAVDAKITLPPGLSYVSGTTEVDCGTGFAPAGDPMVSGQTLTWYNERDVGNNLCDEVPPGGTIALRFRVQAACYISPGRADASVWFYDCCREAQERADTSLPISPALPRLTVTKTPESVSLDCHDPGDTVTWTIAVKNTGDGTADWVRLEDTLGASLVYVSSSPAATPMGGTTFGWEFGPLRPGESRTMDLTVRLSRPPNNCGTALRTSTARATWGCGNFDGNPNTTGEYSCESGALVERTARVLITDLVASIRRNSIVCNSDGTCTFEANVQNRGDANASGATIRVYVNRNPAYETVQEITAGGIYNLRFTTAPLKCGEEHAFRVVVDEGDAICECDETNNEDTVTASCPCPALVTEKRIEEILRGGKPVPTGTPIEPGDVIRYELKATNVGQGWAFNVDLRDKLPIEFRYVLGSTSASWPAGSYSADPTGAPGPDLSWETSAQLGPNETLTLEFQAIVTSAVVQGRVYTNTMWASGEEGNGTSIPPDNSRQVPADTDPDDSSSVSHVIAAVPALSVDKEIVGVLRGRASIWPTDRVEPGDLIHYRFTVRNVGNGTAYNVDFTDELPAGLEYDTDYADGTYTVNYPAKSGSLGIPDRATGRLMANISVQLNDGATLVANFYAYVTSAVQQGVDLSNYATATGENGYGTPIPPENATIGDTSDDDPDDTDPDDTGLAVIRVAEPGLAVDKAIVDVLRAGVSIWPTATVLPEDVIVYRFVIRNVGAGTAYDVDFTDELPAGLEYLEGSYTVDAPPASGDLGIRSGATGRLTADISAQLNGGATLVATFRARVTPKALPGTKLVNTAHATGVDGARTEIPEANPDVGDTADDDPDDPDPDDTGLESITVGMPALSVDKSIVAVIHEGTSRGPEGPVEPGDIIVYRFMIRNVGNDTAYDVDFTDELPAGLEYLEGSYAVDNPPSSGDLGIASGATGHLVADISAQIAPGGALVATFRARVTSAVSQGTDLVNTAVTTGKDGAGRPIKPANPEVGDTADDDPDDPDPDDTGLATIEVVEPALVTEKAVVQITREGAGVGPPVEPGDLVTFQLRVRNVGGGTAYNVNLSDELPPGFLYLFGSTEAEWPEGFSKADPLGAPGPKLFWDLGATLRSGEALTLTFQARVTSEVRDGERYTNRMCVAGEDGVGTPIPPNNRADVPDDLDYDDCAEATLVARVPAPTVPGCEKAHATAERVWFQTDIAMFAAYEFELLEGLTAQPLRPDTLLPTWIRAVRAEAEEYSLANLLQVEAASGLGLSLAFSPRVLERAAKEGTTPEAALEGLLAGYAAQAGLAEEGRLPNERWIFAEFAGGDPRYEARADLGGLGPGGAWREYDRRIAPSALGMGLLKQAMAARRFLASDRPLDRYLALVLTEAMVNKLLLLDRELALPLPERGIRYFAHLYEPQLDERGRPTDFVVTDPTSRLFDHLALLWGLSEFVAYADGPRSELSGCLCSWPFASEYPELARRLAGEALEALRVLHYDGETLWDEEAHQVSSTANLGLALAVLARAREALEDRAPIEALLRAVAEGLLRRQLPMGGFADRNAAGQLSGAETLAAQLGAIRGLLVAFGLTDEGRYLEAAQRAFDYLEAGFWDELLGVYATWTDGKERRYCYTPFEVGLLVGALRELALASSPERAELVLTRLGRSFYAVIDRAALQLSNAPAGAEGTVSQACEFFHGSGRGELGPMIVADAPLGVAPVLQQRLCLDLAPSEEPCTGLRAELEPWFQTDIAMFAAWEMQAVAPRAEDYADSNLAELVLHSGMGVPLDLDRAKLPRPPEELSELRPLALEFYSGSPRLLDPESRRWDKGTFDTRLVGSAVGMTLLREAQEAGQLLGSERPLERFYGLLLGRIIEQKLAYLEEQAAEREATTGRAYLPHATRALLRDGKVIGYQIVDQGSELFDQLALLWGLSAAYGLAQAQEGSAQLDIDMEAIARLVAAVLKTILELHRDPETRLLVSRAVPGPRGWTRGGEVSTAELGLTLAALGHLIGEMADRPALRREAEGLLREQAGLLLERLADGEGGYYPRYSLTEGRPLAGGEQDLAAQLAAIRGLLAAYEALDDERYLAPAQAAFDYLEREFWKGQLESCRALRCWLNPRDAQRPCYTPLELGLAVGALERLASASASAPERARLIRERLWRFFDQVADGAKLQLPRVLWRDDAAERFAEVLTRRVCLRAVEVKEGP